MRGAGLDIEDWKDFLQEVALKALITHARDPGCFASEDAKRWARHVATNERHDIRHDDHLRFLRNHAYEEWLRSGDFSVWSLDWTDPNKSSLALMGAPRLATKSGHGGPFLDFEH